MDKGVTKPEIIISSFCEKDVHEYIEMLNDIQHTFGPEQGILIHIDSYGGSAYGLIMLYEHLISMGNPIVTYTSSKAMSAGSFILAMAASPGMRFASPNSTILVHEIQSGTGGDIKDMEQQMASINSLNDRIMTLFAKSIGLRTAKEVRELIKSRSPGHDLTLTAEEAKELKIIDEVAYLKMSPIMRFDLQICPMGKKPKAEKASKKPRSVKAKK